MYSRSRKVVVSGSSRWSSASTKPGLHITTLPSGSPRRNLGKDLGIVRILSQRHAKRSQVKLCQEPCLLPVNRINHAGQGESNVALLRLKTSSLRQEQSRSNRLSDRRRRQPSGKKVLKRHTRFATPVLALAPRGILPRRRDAEIKS